MVVCERGAAGDVGGQHLNEPLSVVETTTAGADDGPKALDDSWGDL